MRAEYHKARTDVRSSIRAQARSAHPLMRVPGRWRKDFLDSLSERDRTEYELAVEYWRETWQGLTLPRARGGGLADLTVPLPLARCPARAGGRWSGSTARDGAGTLPRARGERMRPCCPPAPPPAAAPRARGANRDQGAGSGRSP